MFPVMRALQWAGKIEDTDLQESGDGQSIAVNSAAKWAAGAILGDGLIIPLSLTLGFLALFRVLRGVPAGVSYGLLGTGGAFTLSWLATIVGTKGDAAVEARDIVVCTLYANQPYEDAEPDSEPSDSDTDTPPLPLPPTAKKSSPDETKQGGHKKKH